jgi:hypothetical protein
MLRLHGSVAEGPKPVKGPCVNVFSIGYATIQVSSPSSVIALTHAGTGDYKAPPSTAGVAAAEVPVLPGRSLTVT